MKQKAAGPIDRLVGGAIRAARVNARMSQTKLARHCGVTFQQVQKYEKGTNRVGASRMVQIADALGVTVASLYPQGDGKPAEAVPAMKQDRHGLEIMRAWEKLSNRQRVVLRDLVRVMLTARRA